MCSSVKLGYNDHGYNEFTFITEQNIAEFMVDPKWQITTYIFMVIANHGYNKHSWHVPQSLVVHKRQSESNCYSYLAWQFQGPIWDSKPCMVLSNSVIRNTLVYIMCLVVIISNF